MSELKPYEETIKRICSLLQSEPTPDVIQGLRDSFDLLNRQLKAGPFLEVFEATLSNIPFSALFSLLAAPDNKLIVIVSELTGQLLRPVTWSMVHQTFEEYIIQGLDHPHPDVKCLVLNQFLKCDLSTDPFSPSYGPHIWKCLAGKQDSESIKLTKRVLAHLCRCPQGMDYLFTDESMKGVRKLLAGKEEERFRTYDVIVAAVGGSDSAFEFFKQEGIVDMFMNEGRSKDILVIMSFYEQLPDICATTAPFEYMDEQGVFQRALENLSDTADEGVTGSLLRTASLKLFARMVDAKGLDPQQFLERYPVATVIREIIEDHSHSRYDSTVTAINCLGAIGNNPAALEYLAEEDKALAALASLYNSSTGELRIECLKAIACIFGHSQAPTSTASQACFDLYMRLCDGKFLSSLVKEIMKGFEESCIAAFAVIQKMASHAWGVREIASVQNILSFLLTRDPSRGKTVQQWQYSAIESLAAATEAKASFDEETYKRLQKYVNNGPFYVESVPRVAMATS
ncbi:hypothetical protein EC988_003299 [Linderina pennispora]|nr:hypothetical protein EC988_003299 [Linderina pennispora]